MRDLLERIRVLLVDLPLGEQLDACLCDLVVKLSDRNVVKQATRNLPVVA